MVVQAGIGVNSARHAGVGVDEVDSDAEHLGQAVLLVALETLKCRTSCCVPAICWSLILVPGRDLSVTMCGSRSVGLQLQMFVQPSSQLHCSGSTRRRRPA